MTPPTPPPRLADYSTGFLTMAESMIHFSTVRSLQPARNLSVTLRRQRGTQRAGGVGGGRPSASRERQKDTARRRQGPATGGHRNERSAAAGPRLRTQRRLGWTGEGAGLQPGLIYERPRTQTPFPLQSWFALGGLNQLRSLTSGWTYSGFRTHLEQ